MRAVTSAGIAEILGKTRATFGTTGATLPGMYAIDARMFAICAPIAGMGLRPGTCGRTGEILPGTLGIFGMIAVTWDMTFETGGLMCATIGEINNRAGFSRHLRRESAANSWRG